ncbi:Histone-lysine N-methyltransferase, H3 lysine-79 specific [Hondaea fermentalgiana]|uniref:Histone-lysine N-methyltransferase, H3 lysine-79 specific n=1 Tax=Hondaea fermentalgiana TaxID=2315210 RepID=A0A2R5GRV8_9STRA|nr:Histone-lysine N-methyltransferase, H3 lysine-79 specific [Hondaea fermentalgiana]|eukprot:GBG30614.1 Histone-lysine N-methyltransferase, H3 lysine-79 specific [Hondaea fermentalgiana]
MGVKAVAVDADERYQREVQASDDLNHNAFAADDDEDYKVEHGERNHDDGDDYNDDDDDDDDDDYDDDDDDDEDYVRGGTTVSKLRRIANGWTEHSGTNNDLSDVDEASQDRPNTGRNPTTATPPVLATPAMNEAGFEFSAVFAYLENKGWGLCVPDRDNLTWIYLKNKTVVFDRTSQVKNRDFFESEAAVLKYFQNSRHLMEGYIQHAREMAASKEDGEATDLHDEKALLSPSAQKSSRKQTLPKRKGEDVDLLDGLPSGLPSLRFKTLKQRLPMLTYEEWAEYWEHLIEFHGGLRIMMELGFPRDPGVREYDRRRAGFATPSFVQTLISCAGIRENDRYLDLGCGIGATVLPVCTLVGCPSVGIEMCLNRASVAKKLNGTLQEELDRHKIFGGRARIYHGDYLDDRFADIIRQATVIFLGNDPTWFQFDELRETNKLAENIIIASKVGSRIVTLMPIKRLHDPFFEGCFHFSTFMTLQNASSWCPERLHLLVYHKVSNKWTCVICKTRNRLLHNGQGPLVTVCAKCKHTRKV